MPTLCRYCGAEIIWGLTLKGKQIPLDPLTVRVNPGLFERLTVDIDGIPQHRWAKIAEPVHRAHFETCGKSND